MRAPPDWTAGGAFYFLSHETPCPTFCHTIFLLMQHGAARESKATMNTANKIEWQKINTKLVAFHSVDDFHQDAGQPAREVWAWNERRWESRIQDAASALTTKEAITALRRAADTELGVQIRKSDLQTTKAAAVLGLEAEWTEELNRITDIFPGGVEFYELHELSHPGGPDGHACPHDCHEDEWRYTYSHWARCARWAEGAVDSGHMDTAHFHLNDCARRESHYCVSTERTQALAEAIGAVNWTPSPTL